MFSPYKFTCVCVVVCVWSLCLCEAEREGSYAAGKITNCEKNRLAAHVKCQKAYRVKFGAPPSPAIGTEVEFPKHIRESLQGHRAGMRPPPPQSPLEAPGAGAAIHLRCGSFKRTGGLQTKPEPHGPVKFPHQDWVELSPGAGTVPALSYQPASSLSQAGWGEEGQPIDLEQAPPTERDVGRNRPVRENRGKINLGRRPYEFREHVWNETVARGHFTYHWDIL